MAAIHDLPAGALQKLSAEFLTGGHTRLWEGWGAADVVPGYNKLYYLRQGRFSIQVDGVAYTGRPGQLFLLPCNSTQTYSAYRAPAAEKYSRVIFETELVSMSRMARMSPVRITMFFPR